MYINNSGFATINKAEAIETILVPKP